MKVFENYEAWNAVYNARRADMERAVANGLYRLADQFKAGLIMLTSLEPKYWERKKKEMRQQD